METIIVTRHAGAMEWLRKNHIDIFDPIYPISEEEEIEIVEPIVLAHAKPDDVRGKRVIGILPNRLSSLAAEYWELNIDIPADMRGKEISCQEMERLGASLKRWDILSLSDGQRASLRRLVEYLEHDPDMAEELAALQAVV